MQNFTLETEEIPPWIITLRKFRFKRLSNNKDLLNLHGDLMTFFF